jgi:hypothetical protein
MATAHKGYRGSSKFQTFADLEAAGVFEKPLKQRRKLAIGRKEKVTPRDYGLRGAHLEALKAAYAAGDVFPNPHNKGFSYFAIEALKSLGLDRNHSMKRFIERLRELMSAEKDKKTGKTAWQEFRNKEMRNEATGQNWLGRIDTNLSVLQRVPVPGRKNVNPYGLKLLRVGQLVLGTKGAVIDIVYGSAGDVMVRLNTNSDTPINETKKARKVAAAVQAVAAAVATAGAAVEDAVANPDGAATIPDAPVAPVAPVEVAPETAVTPVETAPTAETPVAEVQSETPATETEATETAPQSEETVTV